MTYEESNCFHDRYSEKNALAAIIHDGEAEHARRADEIALSPAELDQYTGTYLPGKIHIEQKNGKQKLFLDSS